MKLSRRTFCKLLLGGGLITGLTAPPVGLAYVLVGEPWWLEVTHTDISVPDLPPALHGLTIAHLSDFHHSRVVPREHVRRAVDLANSLGAELMLLTGDYVTRRDQAHIAPMAAELSRLRAPRGVYAVLGNHDNWTDAAQIASHLSRAGIIVLRNQRRALAVGETCLWLLGIEDTGYTGGRFDDFRAMWQGAGAALAALLEGIPPDEPRLLLVHNPDFTEMLPAGRIDLALCGHTHGGQVCLPGIGALLVPSCFGQKYVSGLVQGPSTRVYVSRGIGLISPPVRFLCRPEIALVRLTAA